LHVLGDGQLKAAVTQMLQRARHASARVLDGLAHEDGPRLLEKAHRLAQLVDVPAHLNLLPLCVLSTTYPTDTRPLLQPAIPLRGRGRSASRRLDSSHTATSSQRGQGIRRVRSSG